MAQETYYVKGMSCTSCAKTFENNVKDIESVEDAHVNFGASKITVQGDASIQQLEQAGAFESLSVSKQYEKHSPLRLNTLKSNWHIVASTIFLLIGIYLLVQLGEEHPVTTSAFLASIAVGGYQLLSTGVRHLLRLRFDMKTLMTIAVIGAAIIGEWVEGAVVVILFAISEALERFSIDRARSSIQSLMELAPDTARVRRNNELMELNVSNIQVGDTVIIKPGEKIPVDGMVTKGESTINQAAITGESVPVFKAENEEVFAGTLNEEGYLEVNVQKLAEDSTLAKIIHLVEEAQNEKAPAQQFIDRFAAYYTPLIMVVALGVATIPPIFFGLSFETWVYQGLAVLVVGCPCALVISTPVAIVTAIGSAARNGVLIKGGAYLEALGQVKTIAFDKTGTITQGKPVVQSYQLFDESISPEYFFQRAYALETLSQHPLAKAITEYTNDYVKPEPLSDVTDFQSITGKGVTGEIDRSQFKIGSPSMFDLNNEQQLAVNEARQSGHTVILMSENERVLGLVSIADAIRPMAKNMIAKLNKLNINRTVLLTGDHEVTAKSISHQVGIKQYLSQLLPKDKQVKVKELQEQHGQIAMVGDGVNDAPALATANVGIAMGGAGTDTALETADIALMGDDLSKLPYTMKLSRKALNIIKQNIVFALTTKALALLLVIPGWLTLWIAILADMGATLLVTLNALRLLKLKD
ncbi:heavy metal translocating P-type ATPase [Alkalibacillus haloalkaliphilus]|uniref:heavy metal translocating P-type ATPase n=1 Tax=Alkalibacillus haloalkaliphilus TaxID=94136 RepID=UPI00293554A4|nr:heavy metal translocating P-type ATPase [Alkalibacillus haloalkaliphilus]MDV2583405.1 heavy metal translocating P-type ATPase [Alkalibacillus haloalkaliphilus]